MAVPVPVPLRFVLTHLFVLLFGSMAPQSVRAQEQPLLSQAVAGRYIVTLKNVGSAADATAHMRRSGAMEVTVHAHLGTAAVRGSTATMRAIAADPAVAQVVADRRVYAHRMLRTVSVPGNGQSGRSIVVRPGSPLRSIAVNPVATPTDNGTGSGAGTQGSGSNTSGTQSLPGTSGTAPAWTDTFYQGSPQGWAVRAAGGYGLGVLGGTVVGPWNRSLGTGVRIAVLDSGVDSSHPDIAPNLGLSLSEIDPNAESSPCDDGSPQDEEGHGTWVASLAAGAMGDSTGRVVGVAPAATILNIKVLHRMPGSGNTVAARCQAGQDSGLVSWLLKGIDDAVAQHADVIVLSLGSIVDLYTGDGAGLKSAFDQVTHAAANAGVLIVAAAGNDGFDLSNSRYLELPAQARDVLAVTASTNPDCAEDNTTGAICKAGSVAIPYYANAGAPLRAVAVPGGNYPSGGEETVSGWVRGACSSGKAGTADGVPSDAAHSFGCFNLGHTQYVQAMGTSASAGLAAGAAALVRAAHPGWPPATVAAAMRADDKTASNGTPFLDTMAALQFQP